MKVEDRFSVVVRFKGELRGRGEVNSVVKDVITEIIDLITCRCLHVISTT